MAIYLKRRRTTIEEWSRSPLKGSDAESTEMPAWPQLDEEPAQTDVSLSADLSRIAADVGSWHERDTEEREISKSD